MTGIPAFVHNGRFDILYANPLAAALYSEHFRDPVRPPNSARFLFLDPRARAFYADWETAANDIVATLRARPAATLRPRPVGPRRAAVHAQRGVPCPLGEPRRSLPPDGDQAPPPPAGRGPDAGLRGLELPADPGLVIVTYSAEPGAASDAALCELDRWSGTRARLAAVDAANRDGA